MIDLTSTAAELLESARTDAHGRAAHLVAHDGVLRQLVFALREGAELAEHNAPAAASLQVLSGSARLSYAEGSETADVELAGGDLTLIAHERHGVRALTDCVLLLTTVTGQPDRA